MKVLTDAWVWSFLVSRVPYESSRFQTPGDTARLVIDILQYIKLLFIHIYGY